MGKDIVVIQSISIESFESALSRFLKELDGELIDIKYQATPTKDIEIGEVAINYSALVIFDDFSGHGGGK